MLWHKDSKPILETLPAKICLYLSLVFVVLACATLLGLVMTFSLAVWVEQHKELSCLATALHRGP